MTSPWEDELRREDQERAMRASAEEKARQTLALMADGIRLKRVALRTRLVGASEEEIDRRLRAWLRRDD